MDPLSVLVVDDDRSNCAQVAKFLTDLGYEVDTVDDGLSAIENVARRSYSLVILDYQMPGLNGVEVYERLCDLQPEIPGIFLTAYTSLNTVYPAIAAGIERVLAKPVQREELTNLVERMIGKPNHAPG